MLDKLDEPTFIYLSQTLIIDREITRLQLHYLKKNTINN